LLAFGVGGLRRLSSKQAWQPLAFGLVFALTVVFLLAAHYDNVHIYVASEEQYAEIRAAREQIEQLHPEFPAGSRILVLETPFPDYPFSYNSVFLMRLVYRDATLAVEPRAMLDKAGRPVIPGAYDYVLSFENGRWRDVELEPVAGENAKAGGETAP
jgi:hypothetical protein